MKSNLKYGLMLLLGLWTASATMTSCSDEPDASNYYTFTGEMVSDYLKNHADFSEFATIIQRAGMMDQMSAYGAYTCFAPTNEAINRYLTKKGLQSVSDLTDVQCDSIARTHLVNNMYTTAEMNTGVIASPNMNRRYIEVSHGLDDNDNSVVYLNRNSHIIYELQDDSVENGIMQPVCEVLESSNRMLPDVMKENPTIKLFTEAMEKTGLSSMISETYRDESYDANDYERYKYSSSGNKETATAPDTKESGFTAFVPTDKVLEEKYGITTLEGLYEKACSIYDQMYPEDKDKQTWS